MGALPELVENGWIAGTYPYLLLHSGSRFVAEIGCLLTFKKCDVTVELYYQLYGQQSVLWKEWREVYDEQTTQIDLNLDPLANNWVSFWLVVRTNGEEPNQSAAYWLKPRIER